MKIFWNICFILMSAFEVQAFSLRKIHSRPKTQSQIRNIISKYKKKELVKEIKQFLYQSKTSRMPGTSGNNQAQKYILDRLKSFDTQGKNLLIVDEFSPDIGHAIKFYNEDFNKQIKGHYEKNSNDYKKWRKFTDSMINKLKTYKNYKAKNIIWEKTGTKYPNELIILTANYDTVSMDTKRFLVTNNKNQPGADNNATGVAILLALANVLSEIEPERTIRIVFFDFEQIGFLGSHHFTQKYKEELSSSSKYFGSVNMLALGYDTKRSDIEKKFGNMRAYIRPSSSKGSSEDLKMAKELTGMGEKFSSRVKFKIIPNGMKYSSHINFWKNDLRAMTLSENWENDSNSSRHHGENDFLETLNMSTYYQNFRYILGMILSWSQK